jgi:hypothetical protein
MLRHPGFTFHKTVSRPSAREHLGAAASFQLKRNLAFRRRAACADRLLENHKRLYGDAVSGKILNERRQFAAKR